MKKRKLIGFAVMSFALAMVIMGCQQEPEKEADHVHIYSKTWNFDETSHWNNCIICGKEVKFKHDFMDKKVNGWNECDVCDRKVPVSLDILGTYDPSKMTFGVYPQTIKASNVTVDKTVRNTEITGADYYLGSDGAWYAECIENAVYDTFHDITYSDGSVPEEIYANSKRYFKVEPIEWVYLEETKCLHAKKVLMKHDWYDRYDDTFTCISYANSGIRSWLNEEFYDSAFTESQKKKIKTTTVDNSAASIIDLGNRYYEFSTCEDTKDKIFLLSVKDVISEGNGFKFEQDNDGHYWSYTSVAHRKPTDYAIANNCSGRYTDWALRSYWDGYGGGLLYPFGVYCDYVSDCCSLGSGGGDDVVPALAIYE